MSFTVINPADTFLIEGGKLETLNFEYRLNGGLKWAEAKNPYKGCIKGKRLAENTWQIEVNVQVRMIDTTSDKETEKQVVINNKFSL